MAVDPIKDIFLFLVGIFIGWILTQTSCEEKLRRCREIDYESHRKAGKGQK